MINIVKLCILVIKIFRLKKEDNKNGRKRKFNLFYRKLNIMEKILKKFYLKIS